MLLNDSYDGAASQLPCENVTGGHPLQPGKIDTHPIMTAKLQNMNLSDVKQIRSGH